MKIALGQVNPTVGDFDGNVALCERALADAEARGAELLVLPELAVCGYPPRDFLERPAFVAAARAALERIVARVGRRENAAGGRTALVIGFPERREASAGRGLSNAAALIDGGRVLSVHRKTLLPTYDVFDEWRYFDPAGEVACAELRGRKLGISICEDVWNDADFWPTRRYRDDPIEKLVAGGAEILINIAASPYTIEKRHLRPRMLAGTARRWRRPLVFVNQVGGQDDLVFDGASLAFAADGAVVARAAELTEALVVADLAAGRGDVAPDAASDEASALAALVLGTRDYARRCGFGTALVGLSGGVDSALVATIAARALGPENVVGVTLPSRYSSEGSWRDAEALADALGIRCERIDIEPVFIAALAQLAPRFRGKPPDVTEENLQARVRGLLLMALSNKHGHLLLSTGNKSELATGYSTLYGDMCGGLAVISDVPKTLVYRLAWEANRERAVIPEATLTKAPSAELRPNQTDQDTLPPYDVLDAVLDAHLARGLDREALLAEGFDRVVVDDVIRRVRGAEYKRRQMPPGLKITGKAFGPGRRYPIAHGYRG